MSNITQETCLSLSDEKNHSVESCLSNQIQHARILLAEAVRAFQDRLDPLESLPSQSEAEVKAISDHHPEWAVTLLQERQKKLQRILALVDFRKQDRAIPTYRQYLHDLNPTFSLSFLVENWSIAEEVFQKHSALRRLLRTKTFGAYRS